MVESASLTGPKGSHLKPNHDSPAGEGGQFRTTRWSAVLLSARTQAPGSQKALAELCRIYWHPAFALGQIIGPITVSWLVDPHGTNLSTSLYLAGTLLVFSALALTKQKRDLRSLL